MQEQRLDRFDLILLGDDVSRPGNALKRELDVASHPTGKQPVPLEWP